MGRPVRVEYDSFCEDVFVLLFLPVTGEASFSFSLKLATGIGTASKKSRVRTQKQRPIDGGGHLASKTDHF
jgi:hypothetical protein